MSKPSVSHLYSDEGRSFLSTKNNRKMQKGQFYTTAGGLGIETPEDNQVTPYQDSVTGNTKLVYPNNAQSGILGGLVAYANNAAAIAGGLAVGDYYRIDGAVSIVIKQL
jgi:hypothetical protein